MMTINEKNNRAGERIPLRGMTSPFTLLTLLTLLTLSTSANAALEREQLAIESQIKARIEDVLSKTLPPNSYLVNVKVEMETKKIAGSVRTSRRAGGDNNPFLNQNRFVLPGVPVKKELTVNTEPPTDDTVVDPGSAESLIKRVLVSIMVAPDIPKERTRALQDLVTANIPFNPLRGDEIDIENSPLLNPTTPAAEPAADAGSSTTTPATLAASDRTDSTPLWYSKISWPVLTLAVLLLAVFTMFVVFLFGPVRAFLNRLLTVLPRVGEQAAYAVNNAPAKTNGVGGTVSANGNFTTYSGNGNGKHIPEGVDMPFRFINEEILSKLPILLRQMPADQTAVVLAYLTPEWAGRILNGLDTASQTAVMRELSQAREIPSDIVKEIETQVKAKLPYLVGGTDWIQSVYQLTQPATQRALLGSLTNASPELAQTLRSKSFFYEDLGGIAPGALRLVIQEAGYPTVAAALRDEKAEIRATLLGRLPVATREILEQEMEMAAPDTAAGADAKARIAFAGRKLLAEGRIALAERK